MVMVLKPSAKTVDVRIAGGGNLTVPAYETEDGKLVAPSWARQPLKGPRIHGGHCSMCSAELEPFTTESNRGVCDACAGVKA